MPDRRSPPNPRSPKGTAGRNSRRSRSKGRRRGTSKEAEPRLRSLDRVREEIAAAVRRSPADDTEVVWLESRRCRTGLHVPTLDGYRRRSRQVLVRVRDGRRTGAHRTGGGRSGELDGPIRLAMAAARASAPESTPSLPDPGEPPLPPVDVHDPALARLHADAARRLLKAVLRDDEAAVVEWTVGQAAVANSRELVRGQRATAIQVEVRSGNGPGAGFVRHAARSIDELDLDRLVETARARRAPDNGVGEPPDGASVLLAPEATLELLELLNLYAFSSRSIVQGESFLLQHMGVQVFDRRLHLLDDGGSELGLPFPFDLEGRTKTAVELVTAGVPKTPALDTATAARVGLEPTCHCTGGEEACPLNMFLGSGDHNDPSLFEIADGGIWISRLDEVECFDPGRMRVRARARGVRRVRDGRLGEPVVDLVWEDSLLRVLSNLLAIGATCYSRTSRDGFLGGTTAPALVVSDVDGLAPAPEPARG